VTTKALKNKGFRRLTVLDLENLAQRPVLDERIARAVDLELRRAYPLDARDITYVGGNPKNGFPCRVFAELNHGSVVLRPGRDGADHALIDRVRETPESSFLSDLYPVKEFVIGSGDHEFVDVALEMKARGLTVTVIARPESLNRTLAATANRVIHLPKPNPSNIAIAA